MLQLILFSPDSIVPSGAALLSSISILPVFYVYSYPNETQPLVTRVSRDRLSLSSPFHLPCISLATSSKKFFVFVNLLLKIYNTPCTFRAPKAI